MSVKETVERAPRHRVTWPRAGDAEDSLRPLQARTAPEDQPADLRPERDRGEEPEDAWPSAFNQGHQFRDARTDARLGRKRHDDEDPVFVRGIKCG